ncbi:hypothetical protein RQP46_008682 [Phenoliferia psychrophenolica]
MRKIVTGLAQGEDQPEFSERLVRKRLYKQLADPDVARAVAESWTDALASGSLYQALERLDLLESAGQDREARVPVPGWLFLALPALLHSPNEAIYLAGMFLTPSFHALDPPNQGLFIARAIQFFIRCRHFVAAREAVDFLCDHHHPPAVHLPRTFARCLHALTKDHSRPGSASGPPHDLLVALATRMRSTMAKRKIERTVETCRPLFHPALIPRDPAGAHALLASVVAARVHPPPEFLHSVMKVYASSGLPQATAKLRDQIYRMVRDEEAGAVEAGNEEAGAVEAEADDDDGDFADLATSEQDELRVRDVFVKLETTYLRSLTNDPPAALKQFELLRAHIAEHSHPHEMRRVWTVLFYVLSVSRDVTGADLLGLLHQLEHAAVSEHRSHERATARIYTIVLQGLLQRREYEHAISLWYHVRRTPVRPDLVLFTAAATAFARHGDLALAERTLREFSSSSSPPTSSSSSPSPSSPPPSPTLDAAPLNVLMSASSRAGRYQATYDLFQRFPSYGVRPNAATISILLDTARYASAASGKGFGPGDEALPSHAGGGVPDRWDGQEAWRVGEQLVWSILEQGWPDAARSLRDPRSTGGIRAFLGLAPSAPTPGAAEGRPFARTLSPDSLLFPQIHPSERLFRSFIQLLGYHSTSESIPLVLAWMRFLDVRPTRETLVLAVLYIDEGAPTDGQRRRLREWLEDWLGRGMAPSDDAIAKKRRGGNGAEAAPFN